MTPFIDTTAAALFLEKLGWVLVHSLWQFAAVAAVTAAATAILGRSGPRLRHGVLVCGLMAMAASPVITWSVVEVRPQEQRTATVVIGSVPAANSPAPRSGDGSWRAAAADGMRSLPPAAAWAEAWGMARAMERIRPWLAWLTVAWLVGAATAVVRPVVGWLAWRRLTARGTEVPSAVSRMVERARLRLGVGRAVQVLQSAAVQVPAVAGWLRPVMLVPAALVTSMPLHELETLIVHELAHVRRGDFLVHVLQTILETLAFYHPAVWWLSDRIRVEREHCCDDLVVSATGHCAAYGRALVAVAELQARRLGPALGAADGSLVARIRRLVTGVDPVAGGWSPPAFAAAALMGLTLAVGLAARAGADELPADTDSITSLTPEQARSLRFVEGKEASDRKVPQQSLPLRGLKSLDAATASVLAGLNHGPSNNMLLDGLTALDAETAQALAAFRGSLSLNGLTALDRDTAQALAAQPGMRLGLDGLTSIDAATAQALVSSRVGGVSLNGLTSLDATAARMLVSSGCILSLNGLKTLAPETAKELTATARRTGPSAGGGGNAGQPNCKLHLNGLAELSPETAAVIAAAGRPLDLSFDGLKTLSPEATRALAKGKVSSLSLNGLTKLSPEAARALAASVKTSLDLNGLTELDEEAAKELVKHKVLYLSLGGLTSITPAAARALAEFSGERFQLNGLTALDADAAGALAGAKKWDGSLPNLTSLDAATARSLAGARAWNGFLPKVTAIDADTAAALAGVARHNLSIGLTTLDARTAQALVSFGAQQLVLNGLATLDADTAQALASFRGQQLVLDGLATLDADTAQALASFRGQWLGLNGLTTLDANTAQALVACRSVLSLGMTSLVADTAKVLAGFQAKELIFPHLSTLDADAAQALSSFQGVGLHFSHLHAFDADTAKALAGYGGLLQVSPMAVRQFTAKYPFGKETALAYANLLNGDLSDITAFTAPDSVEIAKILATRKGGLRLTNLKKISPKTLSALIAKEDVQIPLIETLELIPEPDGSATDDFVLPPEFENR